MHDLIPKLDSMLVCLDLTDIDRHLMDYALFIAGKAGTSSIIFTHVIQAYDLADRKKNDFEELREKVIQQMEAQIERLPKGPINTRVLVEIEREDASQRILDISRRQEVDLVVLGKKYGEDRDLRYGRRITEEVGCDLMLVPEDPSLSVEHILCALDFTEASKGAFARALQLQKQTKSKLSCYCLYDMGSSYFQATTLPSSASLEQKLRKQVESFLADFDMQPEDIFCHIDIDSSEGESHARQISSLPASLVVVGAKGDAKSVTSVLGNIIENLWHTDFEFPVMIVKKG